MMEACVYTAYAIANPSCGAGFLISLLPYVRRENRDRYLEIIKERFDSGRHYSCARD